MYGDSTSSCVLAGDSQRRRVPKEAKYFVSVLEWIGVIVEVLHKMMGLRSDRDDEALQFRQHRGKLGSDLVDRNIKPCSIPVNT